MPYDKQFHEGHNQIVYKCTTEKMLFLRIKYITWIKKGVIRYLIYTKRGLKGRNFCLNAEYFRKLFTIIQVIVINLNHQNLIKILKKGH